MMLRFPPPENDNDFDWLVCAVAERKYGRTATRYGRKGQSQHGVDITVRGSMDELIGIQSKHVGDLTEKIMNEEVDKLLGLTNPLTRFPHPVNEFIFATSAKRDTRHTNYALALENAHPPLTVSVWAWETINEHLNTMPTLAAQYTAAVLTPYPLAETRHHHARVLRRALDRPALLDGFRLEFDFGKQAAGLRSIAGFMNTGNLRDSHGVLAVSVPPYDADDDYRVSLVRLRDQVVALARYIEIHHAELQQYVLSSHGRQLDASNVAMMKTYVDFEAKRVAILDRANRMLAQEGLDPLPT